MTSLRLLLIDDDEDVFVLVRDYVAETAPEWTVDWASTYEAGIEGLTAGGYDAALLDYHLGAHTGVDLLGSVRTMANLPPIVLLTGQGDRAIDLAAMATGAADYLEKRALSPALLERTLRHAMEREATVAALRASEVKYHGLFERAGDAVLITDDTGRFVEANPSACALLGAPRDQIVGRPFNDFVAESPAIPDPVQTWAAFLSAGEMRGQVLIRRPDGSIRHADYLATANITPGLHLSVLRDDTDRLASGAALVEAVSALRTSEARFRTALDGVALHAIIIDPLGQILFANRNLVRRTGWTAEELIDTNVFEWLVEDPKAVPEVYGDGMAAGAFQEHIESTWRTREGGRVQIAWTNSAIRDDTGRIVAVAAVGEDVTARREAEATQAQLVAAIGQAAESIVVMDVDGCVIYANPAFETMSGVSASDIIGKEPWKVFRGTNLESAYPRLGRRLKAGHPWGGEWDLTHRDGTPYREEVTVSPVRDVAGAIVHYVRVARDVTELHRMQVSLESNNRSRAAFASALARLKPRDTPEETGKDIADAVVTLPGVDIATLLIFEEDGPVTRFAISAPHGHDLIVGAPVHPELAEQLRAQAAEGAWTAVAAHEFIEGYDEAWNALHLKGVAYAPIVGDDGPIGVVCLGTTHELLARRIADQLPAALEFAAAAVSLIAAPLAVRRDLLRARRRIEAVIAAGAFTPVFQPIVNLTTGAPIGYEALTRFTDGTPPEVVFADAGRSGAGLDLEAATLTLAIAASQHLPAGPWLSVNVTAAMILERDRLARILARRTRTIVLEITEHDAVSDYAGVRATIPLLGADIRVAVDDAGAGVANFGHIVELRPDFVKIDVGLVRGVNHDLTRQALIVGLRYFAQATNGWVIAEGVETEEERQTLIGLGLELGQGYLFGRPADVATFASAVARPSPSTRAQPVAGPAPSHRPTTNGVGRVDPPAVTAPKGQKVKAVSSTQYMPRTPRP
jgi:PAS domain S-box-containing protein